MLQQHRVFVYLHLLPVNSATISSSFSPSATTWGIWLPMECMGPCPLAEAPQDALTPFPREEMCLCPWGSALTGCVFRSTPAPGVSERLLPGVGFSEGWAGVSQRGRQRACRRPLTAQRVRAPQQRWILSPGTQRDCTPHEGRVCFAAQEGQALNELQQLPVRKMHWAGIPVGISHKPLFHAALLTES